ncbi:MAG: linear amide C-N hydrolase [Proteobacteria bacterium]|nr:linear amide C-N hydrolase [Pseudomonadota bacterium]
MNKLFLAIILCICLLPVQGLPCSTFVLDNNGAPLLGKNYDWYEDAGLVIVNKRNVEKKGVLKITDPNEPILKWTSKFGSVTFNNFSREMAFGGMNEAGLVVESSGLPADKDAAPQPDSRPMVYPPQWAQYQLDNYSTVEEVISSDNLMRLPPPQPNTQDQQGLHYLVSDSKGNCATIEFLDGKMVYHTNETMPVRALTNKTYDESLEYLSRFKGYGGFLPIAWSKVLIRLCGIMPSTNALPRFAWLAHVLQDTPASGASVDDVFDILSGVAQPKLSMAPTMWSIVYDIPNRTIHFKTQKNDKLRYVNLASFDFSCATPVKVLDINADLSGDVSNSFIDYTNKMNRDLFKAYSPNVPDNILDLFESFIEGLICTE